jgi:hypothetical protein
VVLVVGGVEVLAVPAAVLRSIPLKDLLWFVTNGLRREEDVAADATRADLVGQPLGVDRVIHAGSTNIATEVGAGWVLLAYILLSQQMTGGLLTVAAVAVLALQPVVGARPHVRVTDEHTEALADRYQHVIFKQGVSSYIPA